MKRFIFLFLMLFGTSIMFAQTSFYTTHSYPSLTEVSQVSLRNPWIGARLSYNMDPNKPLNDNFLFSARVLYSIAAGEKYAVPVVVGAGMDGTDIFDPNSGINFGVYPYYLIKSTDNIDVVIHGGFGYKVLLSAPTTDVVPQQLRFLLGAEVVYYNTNGLPTTISISPAKMLNIDAGTWGMTAVEIDAIVPIGSGLGAMFSTQIDVSGDTPTAFKIGVIVSGQLE